MTYQVKPIKQAFLHSGAPGRLQQSDRLSLEAPVGFACVWWEGSKPVGLTVIRNETNKVSYFRILFIWSFYRSVTFKKLFSNQSLCRGKP